MLVVMPKMCPRKANVPNVNAADNAPLAADTARRIRSLDGSMSREKSSKATITAKFVAATATPETKKACIRSILRAPRMPANPLASERVAISREKLVMKPIKMLSKTVVTIASWGLRRVETSIAAVAVGRKR